MKKLRLLAALKSIKDCNPIRLATFSLLLMRVHNGYKNRNPQADILDTLNAACNYYALKQLSDETEKKSNEI